MLQVLRVSPPHERMLYSGHDVVFSCQHVISGYSVQWLVNGTLLEFNLTDVEYYSSYWEEHNLYFRAIPVAYNHTTIQCVATRNGFTLYSDIATLRVQGELYLQQVHTKYCDY